MMAAKKTLIITAACLLILVSSFSEAKYVGEHIYLVPAGDIDKKALEEIKSRLPECFPFDIKVEIAAPYELPQPSYDPSRGQYNAETILADFAGRTTIDPRVERFLLVADVDLYVPELNFVFGVASTKKGAGIISLKRLRNEFYGQKKDERLFLARAVKEAVHELGHSWKLDHCGNKKCVMFFSNSLPETDAKGNKFCVNCQNDLRRERLSDR